MTTRTSGWRTSTARARWPGSRTATPRPSPRSPPASAFAELRDEIRAGARRRRPHPVTALARRAPLQLLAGRRAPARPVAAHHPGRVPHGRARLGDRCSTSTRWPRAEDENWVWQGADVPAARTTTGVPGLRCRAAAPTRPWCASSTWTTGRSSTDGFALPEAKSDVGWIDVDHDLRRHRLRPRLADRLRLSAHVKRWRRGTPLAEADGGLRGRARTTSPVYAVPRPDRRASSATSSAAGWTSTAASSYLLGPRRRAGPDRRARRRRARRAPRLAADPAPLDVDGRRRDPSGRARCSPPSFDAFLAGERDLTVAVQARRADRR